MSPIKLNVYLKSITLFCLLVGIPFLFSEATLDAGLVIRLLCTTLLVLVLFVVFVVSKKTNRLWPSDPLFNLYLAFVVFSGVSLLWTPLVSDALFEWVKNLLFLLVLFFLLLNYTFSELKLQVTLFLAILGGLLTIYGLYELMLLVTRGPLSIPLDTYQIKTAFGHRNMLAQVLFLTFPFQLYRYITNHPGKLSTVNLILSALTLFLLLLLSNRATWLALLAGTLVLVLVFWANRVPVSLLNQIMWKRIKTLALTMVVTLFISIAFFFFFTHAEEAEQHLANSFASDNGSGKDRIELWKRTYQMIAEQPVWGVGLANWKTEILKFGNAGLVSENQITYYQRPHNDFLWVASELGMFGGLIYLFMFLLALIKLIRRIKHSTDAPTTFLWFSLLFALTGYIIFSFFSFPHERIVQNNMLVAMFSLIITGERESVSSQANRLRMKKWLTGLIIMPLWLFILLIGIMRFQAESLTKQALLARMQHKPDQVIELLSQAESPFYQIDAFTTPLAWYIGLQYYNAGQMDSAILHFKRAYHLVPYHMHVVNNLASAYAEKGETTLAIRHYREVLKTYPQFEESRLNLIAVYYNSNQIDSAYAVLQKVDIHTNQPRFKPFLMAILKRKMKLFLEKTEHPNINTLLPDDQEWYYQQYLKHVSKQTPVEIVIFDALKK